MQASFLTKQHSSFASTLDARVKLSICIVGSLFTIALNSPYSLGLVVFTATMLSLTAVSYKIILKAWLFASFMMFFSLSFSAFIGIFVPGLIKWNLLNFAIPYLRMLIVVSLLLTLALSTPVQVIVKQLQAIKLPGWVSIPLTVAIRFIPTFLEDCKQIRDAARLRPGRGLRSTWRALVVPLIFRMLSSADELAIAAELKGMSASKQIAHEGNSSLNSRDFYITFCTLLVVALAVCLQMFGPQSQIISSRSM